MHRILLARTFQLGLVLILASTAALAGTVESKSASQIPNSKIGLYFEPMEQDPFFGTLTQNIADYAANSGSKWARVFADWGVIEVSPGVYYFNGLDELVNRLASQKVKIFMVLSGKLATAGNPNYAGGVSPTPSNAALTPWLNYTEQIVQRYKGSVEVWEIFNEPNLAWSPTINANDYAQVAKQTAQKIRALDPQGKIILGSTSLIDFPYLQTVLPIAGAFVDVVGIHPYRLFPEQSQDAFVAANPIFGFAGNTGVNSYPAEISKLRTLLNDLGLSHLEIWNTETGYPAVNEAGTWTSSQIQQSKHLGRLFVLSLELGLGHVNWHDVFDVLSTNINLYTSPGTSWFNDYHAAPVHNAKALFGTHGVLYAEENTSTQISATSFSSFNDVTVAGNTVTANNPGSWVQYSISVPQPGDYMFWAHMRGPNASTSGQAVCSVEGQTSLNAGTIVYDQVAFSNGSAQIQGLSDLTNYFYTPCIYAPQNTSFSYPYRLVTKNVSSTVSFGFLFLAAGTAIDEIQIQRINLKARPALTTFKTIAAIFDDRVGPSTNLNPAFQNVNLTNDEFSKLESAAFTHKGNKPILAYWVGQQAVDSFPSRQVQLTLPVALNNPVLVDTLTGTYESLGSGSIQTFNNLKISDHVHLIMEEASLKNTGSSGILPPEEVYNFPNPARGPMTTIRFYLTQASPVTLQIFNTAQEQVHKTEISGDAGRNGYLWNLGETANGVYFFRLSAGSEEVTQKIIILR